MNLPSFRRKNTEEERDAAPLAFDDYLNILSSFQYQGLTYSLPVAQQEEIGGNLTSMSRLAYKSNGVVFACMLVRMQLFAEARFQFRRLRNGRPGDLFGNPDLRPLETPWVGGTTGDLLSRMIQHSDLAGNAFVAESRTRRDELVVFRPDWTSIIIGSDTDLEAGAWDPEATVVGYKFQPGGPGSGYDPVFYLAEEVAHFAPIPDPEARFRGMSWLTPIVREVMADKAATDHKLKFFENGATPNLVVKLDVPDLEKFSKWIEKFKEQHEGAANAYKTLYLGAGADATVVGADLKQLDFKVTQGAGETRIAAAAGVPPVIVGLSEGLEAATYANYGQARRRLSDGTMWPLWRNASASLARIINVPSDAELWVDGRDIPFLREDSKDLAEIKVQQSLSIKQLVEAGFEPDSAVKAITSDDLTQLSHTGMTSVQLLPPGTPSGPDTSAKPKPPAPRSDGSIDQLRIPEVSVHFNDGAFRMDGKPAEVNFAEGAFRVEAAPTPDVNVTVEPAQVNVEPANVNVEPTQITVEAAQITVEAAPVPDVNVRVEPAQVTVEATQVTVEPAQITVETPEVNVTVEAPPPAEVNVQVQPELRAELTIDPAAADALRATPDVVVNVAPTPITVENTVNVEPTPVTVQNEITVEDEPVTDFNIEFKRNPNQTIKSAKITEEE